MREAGLEPLPAVEFHRSGAGPEDEPPAVRFERQVRETAGRLVEYLVGENRADAVMCATDAVTFEVAAALRLVGLRPHEDIDLAGFDGYWRSSPLRAFEPLGPSVTAEVDFVAQGRAMVERLLDRASEGEAPAGDASTVPAPLRIEPRIVDLGTTSPASVRVPITPNEEEEPCMGVGAAM
jgi:DNA-binding LacI/PurR family transcriptional regulator